MKDRIVHVSPDFWNIRGSFKIAGVVDIGTQASLVRLTGGGFAFLDAYSLGSEVLQQVAQALTSTAREADVVCRYGGEEFAVLLPQTTAAQAKEIIQRVMHNFTEDSTNRTTLSIGIISCLRKKDLSSSEDLAQMLKRADQAMYDAKASGKNCVICRI